MAAQGTYCDVEDLLVPPNLRLPVGVTREKYIAGAATEINMKIGRLYKTPIVFNAEGLERYSATVQFLNHLNAHLASGRLIMAMDLSGEQAAVHAYGNSLIRDALKLLDEIVNRTIDLEGAPPNTNDPDDTISAKPMVFQKDAFSGVEAFYDIVQNPYVFGKPDQAESRQRW